MSTSTWTLDPAHSQVEFAVKHMMFTTVRGRFSDVQGTIEVDEARPESSVVDITIDARSIDTRVEDRDTHLRSGDFLDVEKHPGITFRSTAIRGAYAEPGASFEVDGDLTIRGVTKPITLAATFEGRGTDPWGNTRSGFSASASIDRHDFGLTWNQALETGGVLVGRDVRIELQIQVVHQEKAAVGGEG